MVFSLSWLHTPGRCRRCGLATTDSPVPFYDQAGMANSRGLQALSAP